MLTTASVYDGALCQQSQVLAQNPVKQNPVKHVRSEHPKQVRESVLSSYFSFVQLKQTWNFKEATYGLLMETCLYESNIPPQLWFLC